MSMAFKAARLHVAAAVFVLAVSMVAVPAATDASLSSPSSGSVSQSDGSASGAAGEEFMTQSLWSRFSSLFFDLGYKLGLFPQPGDVSFGSPAQGNDRSDRPETMTDQGLSLSGGDDGTGPWPIH